VKLLVLGATGGTGKQIVSQALQAGHEVTVFARDRARVGADHPRRRVILGDLHDGAALADAMRGQDAVISALGRGYSFKSERLMERSVPVLISAMRSAGVRRLVFTSALGVGDSYGDAPIIARLFFNTLLRGIYADKLIGDRMIAGSDLDWTIVRPSKMTDGPLTASYRSGERLALSGMASISRADVAHFILQAVVNPHTIRKTLLMSQ
jgi:putative NADH-flavin reductase